MKQCEIVAVVNGKKTHVLKATTECHHMLGRTDALSGMSRQYKPYDDEGQNYPNETKVLQVRAKDQIARAMSEWEDLINLVGTQDVGNLVALADVVIDDVTIMENVPATHLLYLEKQAIDIRTFVSKIPTLDPAEEWVYDDAASAWRSKPIVTVKTRKKETPIVLVQATPEHPAQAQLVTKDVPVGTWAVTKFSGAIESTEKSAWMIRVNKFVAAVRQARERANQVEIKSVDFGTKAVKYLLG